MEDISVICLLSIKWLYLLFFIFFLTFPIGLNSMLPFFYKTVANLSFSYFNLWVGIMSSSMLEVIGLKLSFYKALGKFMDSIFSIISIRLLFIIVPLSFSCLSRIFRFLFRSKRYLNLLLVGLALLSSGLLRAKWYLGERQFFSSSEVFCLSFSFKRFSLVYFLISYKKREIPNLLSSDLHDSTDCCCWQTSLTSLSNIFRSWVLILLIIWCERNVSYLITFWVRFASLTEDVFRIILFLIVRALIFWVARCLILSGRELPLKWSILQNYYTSTLLSMIV